MGSTLSYYTYTHLIYFFFFLFYDAALKWNEVNQCVFSLLALGGPCDDSDAFTTSDKRDGVKMLMHKLWCAEEITD